jgi:hypothetical protein
VLTVLDPRPLLGAAAILATRFGGTGLIVAENTGRRTCYGRQLWVRRAVRFV